MNKQYRGSQTVALANPSGGPAFTVVEGELYDAKDVAVYVREYSWAFISDNVEMATAQPGQRRNK